MGVKLYNVKIEDLVTALELLGYRLKSEKGLIMEFIRPPFHLYVRLRGRRKRVTILRLRIDIPKTIPPFHKGIVKAEKLKPEYGAIVNAYRKVRAGK